VVSSNSSFKASKVLLCFTEIATAMTGLVQDEKRYQYLTRVTKQKAYMNGKAQIEIKFHDEWNINVVFARSEFDCADER
jgi:hypothetical protein